MEINVNRSTTTALLLIACALFIGCTTTARKGPAFGHEQEFRQQLAESIPVKEYGYTIKDLRFSEDYRKALVVFTHRDNKPGLDHAHRRPDWEFTLVLDDFGRYRGMSMQPFYTPGTANTPGVDITVA